MDGARENLLKELMLLKVAIDVDEIELVEYESNTIKIHMKGGKIISKTTYNQTVIMKAFVDYVNCKPKKRKRDVTCEGELNNGRLCLWVSLPTNGVNAIELVFDNKDS